MEPTTIAYANPQTYLDKGLRDAAATGDRARVAELLKAGADPRWQGYGAAMVAAAKGYFELFEELFQAAWANPTPKQAKARANKNPHEVEWLRLIERAKVLQAAFHYSIPSASKETLAANLAMQRNTIGGQGALNLAVSKACRCNRPEIVEFLVDQGADICQITTHPANFPLDELFAALPRDKAQELLMRHVGPLLEPSDDRNKLTNLANILRVLANRDRLHFLPIDQLLPHYTRVVEAFNNVYQPKKKTIERRATWLRQLAQAKVRFELTKRANLHELGARKTM